MRTLRASEVGSYLFCKRAWWYRSQGIESSNQAEMAAGSTLHRQHGRATLITGLIRMLAWLVLLSALVVLTFYIVRLLIG